ncbi:MAG: AAA family ATPase [Opitutae bacterium]|nr:AAA family ATPase [Opitutae bacterium]
MISAVQFRNFKALRSAAVKLGPFNLVIGPNGSGKTSLIEALLRLRSLAGLPAARRPGGPPPDTTGPELVFHFNPPYQDVRVALACDSAEFACNLLMVDHPPGLDGERLWADLRARLLTIRAFLFDHSAMALPAERTEHAQLAANAGNLAAVLAARREKSPAAFARLEEEFRRIMPEFSALDFRPAAPGRLELTVRTAGSGGEALAADRLSQGTLYLLAILTLAHDPEPPAIVCLEEADRGVHPRMLREVRDALYRLSYPRDCGEADRDPVQVVATTHSPYLLDLLKEHPEEVVLANKQGNAASFERLSDRKDLVELMRETNLGDLWYSGILGGVPGE